MKEAVLPDYTVREVSVILRCDVRLVYNLINAGSLEVYRLGKCSTRITKDALDKLRNTQT